MNAQQIIKSKTMTSEEVHLNSSLEAMGLEPVESDLGEYIVQLRGEPPYHFVAPSMHLSRKQISDLFQEKLGTNPTDDVEELTMIARRVMRQLFCSADMGITGANSAISEIGAISLTENEGNIRLSTSLPRIHVAILGIEKILPRITDLALFLPLLATAGAGQMITCYISLITGPKRADEPDGPEELHIVLLDNGRTRLLADAEQRDALHCIRCGACLNVCPIFRNIGGHSYGTTYQGPIGAVITPHYLGIQDYKHLAAASSLCGACTAACPVKIDLHRHLLHHRRNAVAQKPKLSERLLMRGFAILMKRPAIYAFAAKLALVCQALSARLEGSVIGCWPRDQAYYSRTPWAGRIRHEGAWVLDSPTTNAFAHYLNLAFFLLGKTERSVARPMCVEAELYRAYAIANYDTASLRFTVEEITVHAMLTHACQFTVGPRIDVVGSHGLVHLDLNAKSAQIVNGTKTTLRQLSNDARVEMIRTFTKCVQGQSADSTICTLEAARMHVIAANGASQAAGVKSIPEGQFIAAMNKDGLPYRHIPMIEDAMVSCIKRGAMLHESGFFDWTTRAGVLSLDWYDTFSGTPQNSVAI